MRQWDILLFPFPAEQPHPVVIVSPDDRCLNADLKYVNGLICTSVVSMQKKPHAKIAKAAKQKTPPSWVSNSSPPHELTRVVS